MKSHTLYATLALCIAVMLLTGTMTADGPREALFKTAVPFSFNVGNMHFPAGTYTFSHLTPTVILLEKDDGTASGLLVVRTEPEAPLEDVYPGRLVFNVYRGNRFLSQVWTGKDRQVHYALMYEAELSARANFRASTVAIVAQGAAHSRLERAGTAGPLTPKLKVAVYFFEGVDRATVLSAERVTTQIFKQSTIEVEWRNCPAATCTTPIGAPEFRLAIHPQIGKLVNDDAQAKLMSESGSLGLAIPCAMSDSVCLAYIFFGPISRAALAEGVSSVVVLAHVMAHEIGHALLGPDAHERTGVMQSRLPIAHLERFLCFTSIQSKHVVANLIERNRLRSETEQTSVLTILRPGEASDQK